MNNLIKTQYIHIQSKNRLNGQAYDFDIDFPNRYVECEEDELMSITLTNLSFFHDWYNITEANNAFTFLKVSNGSFVNVVLPTGNYPIKNLCETINALYGVKICYWNKIKNILYFSFAEPHTLSFVNASYEVLGFDNTTYTGTTISSVNVLNPMDIKNLCVRVDGLMPHKCYNLDNTGGAVRISNILCAIPYDCQPFDLFAWTNNNDEYKLYFSEKRVDRVSLRITDFDGNYLTFLPDYTASFKVETYRAEDEDEHLQILKRLLEINRMNLVSKHFAAQRR